MAAGDSNFLKGFLLGGILGTIIGILFAPKAGKELREDIIGESDEFIDKAKRDFELARKAALQSYESGRDKVLNKIVSKKEESKLDGKIRYHYVFCEIKRGSKITIAKDILCFLRKCVDLIQIIDNENSQLSKILKSEYYLCFISYSIFDSSVDLALSKTKLPIRSKFEKWDKNTLNVKLKQHNLQRLK